MGESKLCSTIFRREFDGHHGFRSFVAVVSMSTQLACHVRDAENGRSADASSPEMGFEIERSIGSSFHQR
jgi:hypothetical protein